MLKFRSPDLFCNFANNKNILEFGSGTGGHAKFFVNKGYIVHGIEKSKSMIANCKKIKGFTFQYGDACKIKLKKKYDIILSLFHVLSYQIHESNINNFFKIGISIVYWLINKCKI